MIILSDKIIECRFACLVVIEQDNEDRTYYAKVAIVRSGVHMPIPLLDVQCESYQDAETAITRVFSSEQVFD